MSEQQRRKVKKEKKNRYRHGKVLECCQPWLVRRRLLASTRVSNQPQDAGPVELDHVVSDSRYTNHLLHCFAEQECKIGLSLLPIVESRLVVTV